MSEKRAELLLASVIIARSTSFVFNKLGLGTMSAFNLLAVRFLLAFLLLMLLFRKKLRGVLHERITPTGALGILLILGSILLPHFIKGRKNRHEVQSSSV